MAIFGTGVQAWNHVSAFIKLFSIGEVLVYGLTEQLSEDFALRIERELRVPARRAVMPELKRAEIICTCTTNSEPMFELKHLRSDVHINAIGAYRPHTREIGSDVVAKATIIVDTYEGALNEAGEIVIALKEGAISRGSVYGTIDELVSGSKPSPEDTGITLFKSLGMALEDLVAADLAYRRAREKGIGIDAAI
jgi:ornithine cyclodeaminase/alanine dehydrogenase-like protein (mu-crystallin family)